jgi:hypothetical protein
MSVAACFCRHLRDGAEFALSQPKSDLSDFGQPKVLNLGKPKFRVRERA